MQALTKGLASRLWPAAVRQHTLCQLPLNVLSLPTNSRLPHVFEHIPTKTRWSLVAIFVSSIFVSLAAAPALASAQAPTRSTKDRVYSAAQAAEGRDIYDGRCKSCHTAISHTGPPFRANWDKRPLSDLWDYILEKMPKDAPGTLETDEYTKVLAYILRMNGMPAGAEDLTSDKKVLKAIRIDAPAVKSSHEIH